MSVEIPRSLSPADSITMRSEGDGDILASYPEYASTAKLDALRATEYGYLDEDGHIYLDYTGSGLAARAQHRAHAERLASHLFGNPHSVNPTSAASTDLVDRTRARILQFLNASPEEYFVVFTQNATGAARLIAESYPFSRRNSFVLTYDNHNSVNGIREFARRAGSKTAYVAGYAPELRVDTRDVEAALAKRRRRRRLLLSTSRRSGLFAFPAQSNFSGVRHPLEWVNLAQKQGYDVLVDAAAFLPTARLDLSVVKPEFVLASWYKLFGYPTGVGCLIIRRDAVGRLRRPWFSGGTVQAVTIGMPWHALATDETAFEDGTLNFLSIPDVHFGLDWLANIGLETINTRVRCLTGWFIDRITQLQHSDGQPMVTIYGPVETKGRGGTVCFNFLDAEGKIVDERIVADESSRAGISLRTGCFCNPGGAEDAFGINVSSLSIMHGFKKLSLDDIIRVLGLPSAGAIRVSFGLASNERDVDRFVDWAAATYRDRVTTTEGLVPRERC